LREKLSLEAGLSLVMMQGCPQRPRLMKEKNLPSSKKVASRLVMKTIHTVERGCREA
jgi:hypothetical protein